MAAKKDTSSYESDNLFSNVGKKIKKKRMVSRKGMFSRRESESEEAYKPIRPPAIEDDPAFKDHTGEYDISKTHDLTNLLRLKNNIAALLNKSYMAFSYERKNGITKGINVRFDGETIFINKDSFTYLNWDILSEPVEMKEAFKTIIEYHSQNLKILYPELLTDKKYKGYLIDENQDISTYIAEITELTDFISTSFNNDNVINSFLSEFKKDFTYNVAINNNYGFLINALMLILLGNAVQNNKTIPNPITMFLVFIDIGLQDILQDVFKYLNNMNLLLDNDQSTSNDLDDLEEKLDDPKPDSRLRRDFKSAKWSKKPKLKAKTPAKDEQERFALRTFPQVYRIIDKAIQESGEGKTEWIVRAIIDRLMIDHPHLFEELKSQKDEFPEVRSDAKTGIDFMYE